MQLYKTLKLVHAPRRRRMRVPVTIGFLLLSLTGIGWWALKTDHGKRWTARWIKPAQVQPGARTGTNRAAATPLPTPASGRVKPGPSTTPTPASAMPAFQSRAARNAFEAQVALARIGISSGSIDGVAGSQTRAALRAFQEREGLPATGELDGATRARLVLSEAPERFYVIAAEDLRRLKPLGRTWLAKSQQNELDYETALELVSEKAMAHPQLIRSLNPEVNWNAVSAGLAVKVPHVWPAPVRTKAASVRVRLSTRTLQAFDSNSNLLAHFPCSIARQVDKRPVGQLFVDTIAFGPNYRFDPDMYPESPEARTISQPLMIPSGPNNPVGIAWIGLNKPGYGIHGTPRPEDVGRTESHGCFRLANWNADLLARLVTVGTPVHVEP